MCKSLAQDISVHENGDMGNMVCLRLHRAMNRKQTWADGRLRWKQGLKGMKAGF